MNIYGIMKKNILKEFKLYGCACTCACGSPNDANKPDSTSEVNDKFLSSGATGEDYE
ncbi:MAG: hypothetical protein PHX46_02665 [Bacilli bacterium]|nr:hypothetical protein [Bacilli bacterium]